MVAHILPRPSYVLLNVLMNFCKATLYIFSAICFSKYNKIYETGITEVNYFRNNVEKVFFKSHKKYGQLM